MMSSELIAPMVKIDGSELSDVWLNALVDIRVELGFRVIGRATLRFADPDYELADGHTAGLGSAVEIHARDKGLLMSGDITGVAIEQRAGQAPDFVVTVHDKGHELAHSTRIDSYPQMSYSDVVTKLAQENGLQASVDSTSTVIPYIMKVDSDLALLDALAERIGYDWWFEGKTLHFSKPAAGSTVNLRLSHDLLAFSVRASGMHAEAAEVSSWDPAKAQVLHGSADSSSAIMSPDAKLAKPYAKPTSLTGSAKLVTTATSAVSTGEANDLSKAILDRTISAAVTARGVLNGDARIKLGVSVSIEGAGPLSGTYHVSQVEHIFRGSGFETKFVAGERRPTSLVDTLAGGTAGTNGGRNASFHHSGLVVGVVTNNNDPTKTGRVKVKFPALSDKDESDWARVVMLGAGKSRGAVFVPEVGDEVLVGFENGDVRQPVVIGGLYNQKMTIPKWDVQSGGVKSRSFTSLLGHVVEFGDGDSPDKQHVLLELAGQKTKFRLGKDQVDLEAPSGVPIVLKSGQGSITIGKDGSITIKGTNVTIEADQKVAIDAKTQAEVKGTAGVTIQSNAQTALKGTMVQVEGSGVTEVKGAMVKIN